MPVNHCYIILILMSHMTFWIYTGLETSSCTAASLDLPAGGISYAILDTGQSECYSAQGNPISWPAYGLSGYGQDAQNRGLVFSYTDNGDGTITDNVSGLGYMHDHWSDVHGAGCQRSDPKLSEDIGYIIKGPQGDVCRTYNYVRLVRNVR